MRIALFGAGHIGATIARLLINSGDFQVAAADRDAASLEVLAAMGAKTRLIDFADTRALHEFAVEADAIVNALPYDMAIHVAKAAKEAGVHYFDLTEDVHATQAIMALADNARTAFMPQCGLAPGFIGIAAHSLSKNFDTV